MVSSHVAEENNHSRLRMEGKSFLDVLVSTCSSLVSLHASEFKSFQPNQMTNN